MIIKKHSHLLLRVLLSWSLCNFSVVSQLVRNEILVLSQQYPSWNYCVLCHERGRL